MLYIRSLDEGIEIFKALGSEIRVAIIKQLLRNNGMPMKDLAASLHITNGALTGHIKRLEEAGLIKVTSESTRHGNSKKCTVYVDKVLVDIVPESLETNIYEADINIGYYNNYEVLPTCGLATAKAIIGEVDDARYFAHPDHYDTQILWFSEGFVEYNIPNLIPTGQKIDQVTISVELCSEAPGSNDTWPSDIHFYLNDKLIGTWTSPGDFGGIRGIFTPKWWEINWNQYGLLKQIMINKKGTFIDGLKISEVKMNDFDLDYRSKLRFKFAVPHEATHVGGLTIFGKEFGNYNQDIKIRLEYSPVSV